MLASATGLITSVCVQAHGGGLDAAGCHHDRKNGGYHCHRAAYERPSPPVVSQPQQQQIIPNLPSAVDTSPRVTDTPLATPPRTADPQTRDQLQRSDRATYWKERGLDFDPKYMSVFAMDQKAKDIERARFWSERGYTFNPQYMSAYAMDQKVNNIERARFWTERGHHFNAEYMSAYAMDQKVKDIKRAKYWAEQGLNFSPQHMTAYAMDREAERIRARGAAHK